jgi:alpha-L-arabinofuranosidase
MKLSRPLALAALFVASTSIFASSTSAQSISVAADGAGVKVNPGLWGIFYEEINHAGDGGLYAELVQNRDLEEAAMPPDLTVANNTVRTKNGWDRKLSKSPLEGWSAISEGDGQAAIALETANPLNDHNPRSLRLEVTRTGTRTGVANSGYWGMNIVAGEDYDLTFYARANMPVPIAATLETPDGQTQLATVDLGSVRDGWKKYAATLHATKSAPNARVVLSASMTGTIWFDVVSLFPKKTFKSRPNGMRLDLAQMIADLRPGFMRFPGGCVVEGCSLSNRIQWKNTIGPIDQRPGRWDIWGYHTPEGLGFHEYLQFCEDLNAAPMYVVNVGMSCMYRKPEMIRDDAALQPYIQDTLDALEYAMGPADSTWGALRAKNGHPAPFKIKYVEIGNEDWGDVYHHNYKLFYDAIKAKYPEIITIADEPIPNAPVETVDEHYYVGPDFFFDAANKYDAYNRQGPKIYIGEYAVNQGVGAGNLIGALSEAAFMTGMERNADVVTMASYAPLLENVRDREWQTNLIRFDSSRVISRSSYLVQKLFGQNAVSRTVPITVTDSASLDPKIVAGKVGVGTWNTQAEFKDFKITGDTKYISDGLPKEYSTFGRDSSWKSVDGVLKQTGNGSGAQAIFGDTTWTKYTYSVKARKTGGAEGFLLVIDSRSTDSFVWWNIGGWGNTASCLELSNGGSKRNVSEKVPTKIETGRWYDLRVEVDGPDIACYIDDKLVQKTKIVAPPRLFASAGIDDATGELVLKVVNRSDKPISTPLHLTGTTAGTGPIQALTLAGKSPTEENNFDNPDRLKIVASQLDALPADGTYAFPPYSLTVLRIPGARR